MCVCVSVLDPEWPVSGDGSVFWYQVAQAYQSWWMGDTYGKCFIPCKANISHGYLNLCFFWQLASFFQVNVLNWAERGGRIQAGSLLANRERLASLLLFLAPFQSHCRWVSVYTVQLLHCEEKMAISCHVGRSVVTVCQFYKELFFFLVLILVKLSKNKYLCGMCY